MKISKAVGTGTAFVAAVAGGSLMQGAQPAGAAVNVTTLEDTDCGHWYIEVSDQAAPFIETGAIDAPCIQRHYVARAVYKVNGVSHGTIKYDHVGVAGSLPGDIPNGAVIVNACFAVPNGTSWNIRQISSGESGTSPGCKFNLWAP